MWHALDRKAVDHRGLVWLIAFVMKTTSFLLLSGISAGLISCGSLKSVQQPLGNTDFDPLDGPGKRKSSIGLVKPTTSQYKPGQWVETAMENATFFRAIPKGNASADRVLKAGAPLKVVRAQGSFIKVELNSGDVGYIPSIMVTERRQQTRVYKPAPRSQRTEVPVIPGIPTDASIDDLPPLPDVPPLPDNTTDLPLPIDSVPSPPPVRVQTEPIPLPDLPPPPEVPGLTPPAPVE